MRSDSVAPGCQFASDNAAGFCPEAAAALAEANVGYSPAYGEDRWTQQAADKIREVFETDCEVFFTFNGTAANSLALSALCASYHGVICTDVAHVETDECGGPEFFSNGVKLLVAESREGKLTSESIVRIVRRRSDIHYPKPKVVTVTQATETGTVYTIDELTAIGRTAAELDLRFHMDGARFANAAATLGAAPKDLTWKLGVDVLCFGGTKLGLPVGDAVVFFDRRLAYEFDYRCKQAGQLASKMRFLAAPWIGILEGGVWLEHARRANESAERLRLKLSAIPGVRILFPRQANAVFVQMPAEWGERLRRRGWRYYDFIGAGGARFMCSWATTAAEVDALAADVEAAASS